MCQAARFIAYAVLPPNDELIELGCFWDDDHEAIALAERVCRMVDVPTAVVLEVRTRLDLLSLAIERGWVEESPQRKAARG